MVQVQKGEISFTEAQSQYEATRRKAKKEPDPSNLEPLDENESGTNLPTDSGASGTDLPTNGDNSNAGTDTGKTDKRDSGKSKTKGLSKAIADSLVSLVFGFEAKKTDSGYTLELSEEQYKAILMLQEQVESELKGK